MAPKQWIFILVILLLSILGVQPLTGQAQLPTTDPTDPPKADEVDRDQLREVIRNPALVEPQLLVQVYQSSLRHWPHHKKGDEAVAQILKGGSETIPFLLKLLDGRDYRLKPAVAHLLCHMGCEEARDRIENLLYHPELKGSALAVLKALYVLDEPYAEKLSIGLLAAENSTLRKAGFGLLNGRVTQDSAPALRALLQSSTGDVRYKAFLLLARNPSEPLDGSALLLVGDDYPKLAHDVLIYLAKRSSPRVVTELQAKLSFEPQRSFAFALATLVALENQQHEAFLEPDLIPRLESFLHSRDPLFQVSAAVALANLCHRRGLEDDLNRINNAVIPCLMDVFLKNRYFKDFACMLDLSAACLNKVTGEPFSKDITFWHTWWKKEGKRQAENLFLISLLPEEVPGTLIRCQLTESDPAVVFHIAGEGVFNNLDQVEEGSWIVLPDQDLAALIDFLYTRGFFEHPSLAPGDLPQDLPLIEMRTANKTRLITHNVEAENNDFHDMQARLQAVYQENFWQNLYTRGDWKKWWQNRYAWWQEQVESGPRTERILDDFLEGLDRLPDARIMEVLAWLGSSESLKESLDLTTGIGLLAKVGKNRHSIDAVVEGMVALLTATHDPEFLEPLITYLYGSYNENAFPLLSRVLVDLDRVDASLADARWYVRVMAAQAAPSQGPGIMARMQPLLNDERGQVRRAAIVSLVALEHEAALQMLEPIMVGEDEPAKQTLLKALVHSPGEQTLGFFAKGLQEGDRKTQQAALEGLSSQRSRPAANLISAFVRDQGLASDLARTALEALRCMGGPAAREALLQVLEASEDPEISRSIVLALARLGETSIFPRLEDLMLTQRFREPALEAMALLLVEDFGAESWKYRERWENFPGESQAFFLKSALGLAVNRADQGPSFEEIPLAELVGALRHEAWPVRLATLRVLQDGSGECFGEMTRDSQEEVRVAVAESWEAWLQQR